MYSLYWLAMIFVTLLVAWLYSHRWNTVWGLHCRNWHLIFNRIWVQFQPDNFFVTAKAPAPCGCSIPPLRPTHPLPHLTSFSLFHPTRPNFYLSIPPQPISSCLALQSSCLQHPKSGHNTLYVVIQVLSQADPNIILPSYCSLQVGCSSEMHVLWSCFECKVCLWPSQTVTIIY